MPCSCVAAVLLLGVGPVGPPVPTPVTPPPQPQVANPEPAAPRARASTIRGNTILERSPKKPTYSIGAAVRMGILLGDGARVIQRFGYGFAAKLRIHFVGIGPIRFGVDFHGGHTRFQQRREFEVVGDDGNLERRRRFLLLHHTDFSAGPSFQIPAGPVFVLLSGGGGVALSSFERPRGPEVQDDERIRSVDGMVRGGAAVGVPIVENHGLAIGLDVHKIFSNEAIVGDAEAPADAEPDTQPFDLLMLAYLSYQAWF